MVILIIFSILHFKYVGTMGSMILTKSQIQELLAKNGISHSQSSDHSFPSVMSISKSLS